MILNHSWSWFAVSQGLASSPHLRVNTQPQVNWPLTYTGSAESLLKTQHLLKHHLKNHKGNQSRKRSFQQGNISLQYWSMLLSEKHQSYCLQSDFSYKNLLLIARPETQDEERWCSQTKLSQPQSTILCYGSSTPHTTCPKYLCTSASGWKKNNIYFPAAWGWMNSSSLLTGSDSKAPATKSNVNNSQ